MDTKIFDFAEMPVKEWIASILNEDPKTIFDTYSEESEPLILKPTKDNPENKYMVISLDVVEKDYEFKVDEKHRDNTLTKYINDIYGKLPIVYMSVISAMDNKSKIKEIRPSFDPNTNTYFPVYQHPTQLKFEYWAMERRKMLNIQEVVMKQDDEKKKIEWEDDMKKITEKYNEYITELNNNASIKEDLIRENEKLKNNKRLGIVINYMDLEDVMTDNQELIYKNLPTISQTQFSDPN